MGEAGGADLVVMVTLSKMGRRTPAPSASQFVEVFKEMRHAATRCPLVSRN